ncbi:hypothetical protein DAEQUDRAFT_741476 [Daedalea quercina L-15889]|uniref:Uncharacterized protein n=1 Tax=Daedalea quercina L-15889 TaxID=1314783 RepID=A0A165LB32_9APHY|nr:hypothetical protein DAEQUDRAFT_741476 [Daedalea quercina L-15889]
MDADATHDGMRVISTTTRAPCMLGGERCAPGPAFGGWLRGGLAGVGSREGLFPGAEVRPPTACSSLDQILIMRIGKRSPGDKCAQQTRADARPPISPCRPYCDHYHSRLCTGQSPSPPPPRPSPLDPPKWHPQPTA